MDVRFDKWAPTKEKFEAVAQQMRVQPPQQEIPRYLVVVADPHGYMDKDVGCSFYGFDDFDEARRVAGWIRTDLEGQAMTVGGYPGTAYILDLADPEFYDDVEERLEHFFESLALDVYEDPDATTDDVATLPDKAKQLIRRWLEEDEDAGERVWVHQLKEEVAE